jgi:NAD(P)-dependent dehydrogenase (short-subunit alcohol dehydrogenase family)
MSRLGHENPLSATLKGVLDLRGGDDLLPPLDPSVRIEGRTCLVTGANTGLGRAVARELAARGGRLILACRSGIPETAEDIKRETGNPEVEMRFVDLADLESVHALCDSMARDGVKLDIAVLNAGLMPRKARRTAQGYEVMFGVHFLANRLLMQRWVDDGVLERGRSPIPRVVMVSSEAHRTAKPIDFERFAAFVDYGITGGMAQYGVSKLHMSTLAAELARRLQDEGEPWVSVHSLCPGPINSSISREAPAWLKPVLGAVFKRFFNSPEVAARPVIRLVCAPELEGQTGLYMHLMREKQASDASLDPETGGRLWDASATLLKR